MQPFSVGLVLFTLVGMSCSWEHTITWEQVVEGATLPEGDIIQLLQEDDPYCVNSTNFHYSIIFNLGTGLNRWKGMALEDSEGDQKIIAEIEERIKPNIVYINRLALNGATLIFRKEQLIGQPEDTYGLSYAGDNMVEGQRYTFLWKAD